MTRFDSLTVPEAGRVAINRVLTFASARSSIFAGYESRDQQMVSIIFQFATEILFSPLHFRLNQR